MFKGTNPKVIAMSTIVLLGLILSSVLYSSAYTTNIPIKGKTALKRKAVSAWAEGQKRYINSVKPNRIGGERVNAEKLKRNLPTIAPEKIVTEGIGNVTSVAGEVNVSIGSIDGSCRGDLDGRCRADLDGRCRAAVEAALYEGETTSVLPSYVDNSTLKYFPLLADQGGTSSCSAFSGVYYVFTHMNALARDIDVKGTGRTNIFSPKFSYNLTNSGVDTGIDDLSQFYSQISKNGAPVWSDLPFEANNYTLDTTGSSYNAKAWPTDPGVWFRALQNRPSSFGKIDPSTDTGINEMKLLLNNGYVLQADFYWGNDVLTDYDGGIRGITIKNNPNSTADDNEVGKIARVSLNNSNVNSGHAVTIVGYCDDIWTDINNNNVIDNGELGAFLKVDSYLKTDGSSYGYPISQKEWFSYDYLRKTSSVPNVPIQYSTNRTAGLNSVWWMTVNKEYKVNFVSEIKVTTNRRDALGVRIGYDRSDNTSGYFIASYNGGVEYPGVFGGELKLGAYNFSGGTTATTNTFYMDLTSMQTAFNLAGEKRKWITELSTWGKTVGMKIESVNYRDVRGGAPRAYAAPDWYVPAANRKFPYTMPANSILYAVADYTYPLDPNAALVTISPTIYGPNTMAESTDINRATIANAAVITASGEVTGFAKNNAFDQNNSTVWRVRGVLPNYAWITYKSKTYNKISKYAVTSGNNRILDPSTWLVLASKDGKHWVEVDRQNNQSFTASFQKQYYKFKYVDNYLYYKVILRPAGDPGYVDVAGIDFIQTP